jgi:hypothetical protein
MRSQPLVPGGIRSGWAAAVTRLSVTARPAAVVTTRRVATGRGMSSSSRIAADPDSRRGPEKLIWIHCPTALTALASVQAVAGLPSKALAGSPCGTSNSQDPADEAVTLAAPVSTATVWWPAAPAGSSWRGGSPPAPCGSSAGIVPVAV